MFCCRTPDWKPYSGKCGYCGKDLINTGYACRKEKGQPLEEQHLHLYNINHYWGEARSAVLRRDDYKCVKCGDAEQYRCPECDGMLRDKWCRDCHLSVGGPLEVDHIIPRDGDKDDNSCLHHLENLRTLCHTCHVDVTAEQRGYKFKNVRGRRVRRDQPALPGVAVHGAVGSMKE